MKFLLQLFIKFITGSKNVLLNIYTIFYKLLEFTHNLQPAGSNPTLFTLLKSLSGLLGALVSYKLTRATCSAVHTIKIDFISGLILVSVVVIGGSILLMLNGAKRGAKKALHYGSQLGGIVEGAAAWVSLAGGGNNQGGNNQGGQKDITSQLVRSSFKNDDSMSVGFDKMSKRRLSYCTSNYEVSRINSKFSGLKCIGKRFFHSDDDSNFNFPFSSDYLENLKDNLMLD